MTPETASDWIAWAGLVIPLFAIAWAAVNYVRLEREKERSARYHRFFDLMEQLGRDGYSIGAKMAALFELRKYPEYSDVIIRMCDSIPVSGEEASAKALKNEMKLTSDALRQDQ